MIFDKLKAIIAQQFGVDEDSITTEMSFEDDLGADSVDIVELSMALEEEFDVEETQRSSHKLRKFLRLIDYRRHPFSLPLILFIGIVLTFLLSAQFGLELSLEISGNSRYVISLPNIMILLSGLVFACGFMYIIQHGDFLGIRQTKQGENRLMLIHFLEIILCGAVFLIWLITLLAALFTR